MSTYKLIEINGQSRMGVSRQSKFFVPKSNSELTTCYATSKSILADGGKQVFNPIN